MRGGVEIILLGESIERHQFRLLGDADGALALHVRMAAYRQNAGAGFADVAAQSSRLLSI